MAKRWPPIIGITGFDGGTKPAIALATRHSRLRTEFEFEPAGGHSGSPTGACCVGTVCSITTHAACDDAGGVYQGDRTPCDPNPCTTDTCPCTKTVTISVSVDVTDTETPGCDFHAHKEEILVTAETVDLCGHAWGPFDFEYTPEFDNGSIFINTIGVGLSGPDPATSICFFTDGVCTVFYKDGCGSGYICFAIGDEWYTGDDPCFTVCSPPGTITLSWLLDDGAGFSIAATVTITIS